MSLDARAGDEAGFQSITVKPGDTLWNIANTYLKDPAHWNDLLQYNKQLNADPTVALPGMTLRVPVDLVKSNAAAASLTYLETDVFYRASGSRDWTRARPDMPLHAGDLLRTGSQSRARIKFPRGMVLNLESNSTIAIKPPSAPKNVDLQLLQGKLKALHISLKAEDSIVEPRSKDALYEAAVGADSAVRIEVYGGALDVRAEGRNVNATAGYAVDVPRGLFPTSAKKMLVENMPADKIAALKAVERRKQAPQPAETTDLGNFEVDDQSLSVGSTVSGVRLQMSRTRDFSDIAFDRVLDLDGSAQDAGETTIVLGASRTGGTIRIPHLPLSTGRYWWRVAPVDLLGATGSFSQPQERFVK